MKPRRLHSETTTSIFMDSPRLLLRLVLPHSWTRLASCCGSYGQSHGLTPEVGSSRRTARRNLAVRVGWPISREHWAARNAPISFALMPIVLASASAESSARASANRPDVARRVGSFHVL